MKNFVIKLVWLVTIYLFVFTVLCGKNSNVSLLFLVLGIGQILFLYMVYIVLTDKYKTTKTFKDWYNDNPKSTLYES